MDKLFGEVDAVAAGEQETSAEKLERLTCSVVKMEEEKASAAHVEGDN